VSVFTTGQSPLFASYQGGWGSLRRFTQLGGWLNTQLFDCIVRLMFYRGPVSAYKLFLLSLLSRRGDKVTLHKTPAQPQQTRSQKDRYFNIAPCAPSYVLLVYAIKLW